jgi:hypothetical protein
MSIANPARVVENNGSIRVLNAARGEKGKRMTVTGYDTQHDDE